MWASPGVAAAVQDRVCPPVPPYESEVKEHQWAVPTPCCSQGRAQWVLRQLVDRMAVISKLKLTTSPMVPGHLPSFGVLLPLPHLKCQGHVPCRALSPGSRNPVYRMNWAAGQAPELPAA